MHTNQGRHAHFAVHLWLGRTIEERRRQKKSKNYRQKYKKGKRDAAHEGDVSDLPMH